LELLRGWVANGYFDKKRTALEICKKLSIDSEVDFRISELEKCLKKLCGSKLDILQKKSSDGFLRYWKKCLSSIPFGMIRYRVKKGPIRQLNILNPSFIREGENGMDCKYSRK